MKRIPAGTTALASVALMLLALTLQGCMGTSPNIVDAQTGDEGTVNTSTTESATSTPEIAPATGSQVSRIGLPPEQSVEDKLRNATMGLAREQRSAVMTAYTKSLIYANYNNDEKVLESLDEIVKAAPDFAFGHVLRGEQLKAMGRIDDASAAAMKAVELDPEESDGYYLLAQIAGRKGNPQLEREYLEKATTSRGSSIDARRDLASALKRDQDYEAAAALYKQLIEDDPKFAAEYSFQAGLCLSRAGHCDEALEYFLAILQFMPDHRPTALEVGQCYRELGDYEKAHYYFLRVAISQDGTGIADAYSRIAYQNLGEMAYEQERWQDAVDYIQQALRLDPGYSNGRKLLGILLFRSAPSSADTAARAATFIESYLKTNPDDPEALRYLAYAYATMGEAGKAYNTAQKIEDPALLPEVRLVIGRYLIARGREDEGLRLIRSVRESGGYENIQYTDALWSLAYAEAVDGHIDKAKEYLDRIKPDDRRAAGYAYMSSRLLAGKRFDIAYQILDAAQVRAATDPLMLATIGDVWTEVIRYPKAEAAYESALDATPTNTSILLRLASLYDRMDAVEKADETYKRLTEIAPNDSVYHLLWGRFYLKRKQAPVTAIRHFERAVFIDPDNDDAHYLLAVARKDFEGPEAGERILHRFLEAHPDSRRAYDALAKFYLADDQREGHFEHALGMIDKALDSRVDSDVVSDRYLQSQKARILHLMGNENEAEEIYRLLYEADPDSVSSLLMYAGYYIQRKTKLEEMEKLLLAKAEDDTISEGDRREVRFSLTLLYDAMKRHDEAYDMALKIMEDDPFNAAAANLLGYMYAEQNIRLDDAQRLIELALNKEPYSGAYIDSYGWVLYRKGQYEKALQYLLQAEQLEGPDPVIYEHIGDCYAKLGRWPLALQYYEKGQKTDPTLEGIAEKIQAAQSAVSAGT